MARQDLPPRFAEQMMLNGAVVVFGPDYLKTALPLLSEREGALAGKAVLSCEKIDDVNVPPGPALNALMIFCHRMPADRGYGAWQAALLSAVELRSLPPKRLGVEDGSGELPKAELVPLADAETQLLLTWTRPLESSHLVRTARAIERAYAANGGRYDPPGLLRRLRGLF